MTSLRKAQQIIINVIIKLVVRIFLMTIITRIRIVIIINIIIMIITKVTSPEVFVLLKGRFQQLKLPVGESCPDL